MNINTYGVHTAAGLRFMVLVSVFLSIAVPSNGIILDVPEVTQEQDQWCWAGSSKAVFSYYGKAVTQPQIASFGTRGYNTWNYLYGSDSTSPYYRKGINLIFSNWGLSCVYGDYCMSLTQVQDRIAARQPFIIRWGWDSGGGHFVVGRGESSGTVHYMDPWYGEGYCTASYSWVARGGGHTWTHSLELTTAVTGSLIIQTNGFGTVVRYPAGTPEAGKLYKLTATPKTGSVFTHWIGDVIGVNTNKVMTFVLTSDQTITAVFTDIKKPVAKITAPTASQRILATNGSFTVRGTASDNGVLGSVWVKQNEGPWLGAGTTNALKNWNIPVTLTAGTNLIWAYAMDTTGNCSLTSMVKCVYVPTGILDIRTEGLGTITRSPAGFPEIGKLYKLTATPKAGFVFKNWSGDVSGTNRVVSFTMAKTKKVIASFTDIQKPTVRITYPANSAKVMTNDTVILRGTAADNGMLGEVRYQLHTGEWTNAVSTNVWKSWIAAYKPIAGLNTSKVYSVDVQGNISATSTVVFTYIPGAVMTVETNGLGTISPAYNGKVLQIDKLYSMTATAKRGYVFTNWTYGVGGPVATNARAVKFVMQSNLVLTANFRNLSAPVSAAAPVGLITVDGAIEDWTDVPRSAFSYSSVTQEVAAAISGNNIALLLTGCPFDVSDTMLVYFKLRLTYGDGDDRHTLDLWTSGSELYAMVDGQTVTGLEAVLLNGVLEVKLPVEQVPSHVIIEEVSCGMDLGDGTLTELFRLVSP